MTSAEIARELRAARPVAPTPLRMRILADAARPAPSAGVAHAPSFFGRVRRHRLLVLVPAAVAVATVAAVAIGVTRPADAPREAIGQPAVEDSGRVETVPPSSTNESAVPGYGGTDLTAPTAKSGAPADTRAQRIVASLVLQVEDGDALSTAVRDSVRITRSLGGYVVRSEVVSGDTGAASITVRVPAAEAQDAIARLSALGTIVGQRIQSDDLQSTLDALEAETLRMRTALAKVRVRLASEDLTTAERVVLQAQRDQLVAQLRVTRGQHTAVAAEAAEATIDLSLSTEKDAGAVPPPSRLDRTMSRALDVLAWEAVTVLGLLVVLAPLGLAVAGVRYGRRAARRWTDTRTLETS